MTLRTPKSKPASHKHAQEHSVDRMVEDSFPASDPTQLPGRAAGEPERSADRPHDAQTRTAAPKTIGNQGVAPASRMLEETVALADAVTLSLRLDVERRRLLLGFGEDTVTLDARGLDRLIAILSSKRALLKD